MRSVKTQKAKWCTDTVVPGCDTDRYQGEHIARNSQPLFSWESDLPGTLNIPVKVPLQLHGVPKKKALNDKQTNKNNPPHPTPTHTLHHHTHNTPAPPQKKKHEENLRNKEVKCCKILLASYSGRTACSGWLVSVRSCCFLLRPLWHFQRWFTESYGMCA